MTSYEVDKIFWRNLTGGDYFNIEKQLPIGARGQLHIDLAPAGPVEGFLGINPQVEQSEEHVLPDVGVIGDPATSAALQFNKRPNGRWSFPQQNFRDPDNKRHPAWAPQYGWPRDAQNPPTEKGDGDEALEEVKGVHVYVVRTTDGRHFAGMTVGNVLPAGWPEQLSPLFNSSNKRTGCIYAAVSSESMSSLARDILSAFTRRKNVLIYGPPGTGKTHAVAQLYRFLSGGSAEGLKGLTIDPENVSAPFSMTGVDSPMPLPTRTDWVTFHQDYGYEDFMIGLRPTGQGFDLEPVAGRLLDVAMDVMLGTRSSGLIVVDEINRGNVPKILGDFLTFMDDEYRDGGQSPIAVRLPKLKGEPGNPKLTEPIRRLDGGRDSLPVPWYFPGEVYLLATMNSVDRAVAPLDTALGRRFERIDAKPDLEALALGLGVELSDVQGVLLPRTSLIDGDVPGPPEVDGSGSSVDFSEGETEVVWSPGLAAVSLLRYLNDEIAERLGVDFELGHVYFFGVHDWSRLAQIWDLQIWPQLRDRFGARPDQLAEILRVDSRKLPEGYPFTRRRPAGRALAAAPVSEVSEQTAAATFYFLCTGRL